MYTIKYCAKVFAQNLQLTNLQTLQKTYNLLYLLTLLS